MEIGLAVVLIIVLAVFGTRISNGNTANAKEGQAVKNAERENLAAQEKNGEKSGTKENNPETGETVNVQETFVEGQYPIMGESSITADQLVAYFQSTGMRYPTQELAKGGADSIESFAKMYCEEAAAEGVRPEVAFLQSMKETGWLQFGGDASIEQFNFAGIGTTGGGVPGNSYPDVRTGIRAQIQHLKAYATSDVLNQECVDDRYEYVRKGSAPYVEWLGQKENPDGAGWATAENYGYSIVDMIKKMRG